MRKGFLSTFFVLLAAAHWAIAQPPTLSSQPAVVVIRQGADGDQPAAMPIVTMPQGIANDGPAPCCEQPCDVGPQVCGPPGRVWFSAEYLLWWIKPDHLPPLVTTGPAGSTGILGAPGTTVLLGGSDLDSSPLSGGRFAAGVWLNECQTKGIEAYYFFLGKQSSNFNVTSAGTPGTPGSAVIARPFFNVLTGAEDTEIAAFPGVISGSVSASSSSRLQGGGANFICNVCCGCNYRVDLLAGFSYLDLDEDLVILESATVSPGVPTFGGSTVLVRDSFSTSNRFYGGLLGARSEFRRGRAFVDLYGAIALGTTHQVIRIDGSTTVTSAAGVTTVFPGGLLALPTNSGSFTHDAFSVVPQIGVNVGYQVTRNLRAFVGYSFLYWTDVVRPGDQIDRVLNPTQIPTSLTGGILVGPARPAVLFKESDLWAHGINFGVQLLF